MDHVESQRVAAYASLVVREEESSVVVDHAPFATEQEGDYTVPGAEVQRSVAHALVDVFQADQN